MDKATPTPASVDSVMALADGCAMPSILRAEVERLAAQSAPTDAYHRATQPSLATGYEAHQKNGLAWAVNCWVQEVKHRPLINVHRRTLDDTWRQVIRYFGGDPDSLIGPSHDALMDAEPKRNGRPISWGEEPPVAQSAPLAQQAGQREYPPLPDGKCVVRCGHDDDGGGWIVDFDCEGTLSHQPEEGDQLFTADQLHAYVDADRAAAQAEPVPANAAPSDQIIELAQALEQRRALAITDVVHNLPIGGRTANMPTAFQAGYCAACEEIEHRLRTEEWTHCLRPVGAARTDGAISRDSFSGEQLRAAYDVSTARGYSPEGSEAGNPSTPAAGNFAEWARVWHDTASAIATIAGGDPNLDPKGMIESVQNAAQAEPQHQLLVITAKQLRAALDFVNPDAGDVDQLETEICIQWGEERDDGDGGTEPAGLRAWIAEYPEEGSISLDLWGTEEPPIAAQAEAEAMPPAEWLAEAERMANRIGGLAYHAHLRTQLSQALDELRAHLSKRVTGDAGVRMLTLEESRHASDGSHEWDYVESVAQIRAFCKVNAGRVIPADGEVRNG